MSLTSVRIANSDQHSKKLMILVILCFKISVKDALSSAVQGELFLPHKPCCVTARDSGGSEMVMGDSTQGLMETGASMQVRGQL